MYLSNNDDITGVDVDDNTEAQPANTPPATSVVRIIYFYDLP